MSTQTVPIPAAKERSPALALVAGVALLLAFYWPTLRALMRAWDVDPNYSHGWLVVPFSAWLAYRAAKNAPTPEAGQPVLAGCFLTLGVAVHLLALVLNWPLIDFLSVVIVLRAWAVSVGGQKWAAHFTFPILFLFFMFPLPAPWTAQLALWLQEMVSVVSAGVLNLFVVCHRQGTALHLAGMRDPLVVAEACSGLRQIIAFLALAALVGYLTARPYGFRVLLFLAAVPIAVLANVLRVLLMAFGAYNFGTRWMSSWLHDVPAAFSLPVGLLLFFLFTWGLGRLWPAPAASVQEKPACP